MSHINRHPTSRTLLAIATGLALVSAIPVAISAPRTHLAGEATAETHQEFIVKYRNTAAVAELQRTLDRTARAVDRSGALALHVRRNLSTGALLIRSTRALDRVEAVGLLQQFAADPEVAYAEVNGVFTLVGLVDTTKTGATPAPRASLLVPNDELYSKQWALTNPNFGMNIQPAWDKAQGEGTVVAVIDTGILPHTDLSPNVLPGYDFITDPARAGDGDGRDADATDAGDYTDYNSSTWHGTHVSGTVAAVTNNAKGVAGVAFKSKLLPVRALGKKGGTFADVIDAMVWSAGGQVPGIPANPTPADVINMSLSASNSDCSAAIQDAINQSVALGTTLVAAAGNSNSDVARESPANCENIIAVASTDPWGWRSNFSCWGPKIDVAAPGRQIWSTRNAGKKEPAEENYFENSGTSMAAPHVAGVIALMQSAVDVRMTPAEVESTLKAAARPWTEAPDKPIGPGYLDAMRAVTKACELKGCGTQGGKPPVAGFTATVAGLKASFTDTSTDPDGQVVEWLWDFGDGGTDKTRNPTHSYAKAGTYTVKLTVRDNSGKSASTQQSVEVKEIPSGNELQNNVPVNVAGAQGSEVYYTLQLPEGQSRLAFTLKGGSGDADLYVRHGQKPTTSSYDCRPYKSGNDEVCEMTPKAGTWHVLVRGYRAFDGATLTASHVGGGGGTKTYANEDDVTIVDKQTVRSAIAVSGREGAKGQAATRVNVAIAHTYIGDLTVSLQSPSGQRWVLHNRSGGSADDVRQAYTLDLSAESLEGEWVLLVADAANGDTGRIERWDITF